MNKFSHMITNLLARIFLWKHRKLAIKPTEQYYQKLLEGKRKYSTSSIIIRKLIEYEIGNSMFNQAAENYKILIEEDLDIDVEDYKDYANVLIMLNEFEQSINVLNKVQKINPDDTAITKMLIQVYAQLDKSHLCLTSIEGWKKKNGNIDELLDDYDVSKWIYQIYKRNNKMEDASYVLNKIIEQYPEVDKELLRDYIELIIAEKKWDQAIQFLERNTESNDDKWQLLMLYQITGNHKKYNQLLIQLNQEQTDEESRNSYKKLIVFDNGETRIEYYKKQKSVKSIMITFDAINMTWDGPSFAYKLLAKEDIDIIAVRKKEEKTYQQDFNKADFLEAVSPIVEGYQDKMAYGFSLGAYNALYFAAHLNCRILAMAPRLSIHPIFGKTKIIPKFTFHQELSFGKNETIEPIIVYDPKNDLDNRFINEGILPYFPKAKLVKLPYAGHAVAPYLRDMGQLKNFVHALLENRMPKFNNKLKPQPSVYYLNLASACFKHNKHRWALDLIEIYIKEEPKSYQALKLKIKILKKLNQLNEAEAFAREAKKRLPKNLDLSLYLTDILIETNRIVEAEQDLIQLQKKFGKRKSIIKRMKHIQQKQR